MLILTPLTGMARLTRRLAAAGALALLSASAVHAQVIPLYGFTNSSGTYTPLTGATTFDPTAGGGSATPADDGWSLPQTIPFSFQFGFNTYTSYVVSTNGWITFTAGTTSYQSPLTAATDQMIGFFAKDLRADGRGTTYSSVTTGSAPNRIHKIQAADFVQFGNTTASGSAQLWLYENGNIEIHYGTFTNDWTPGTTNGVQVGLRGNGVNDAKVLTGTWTAPVAGTNISAVLPNSGADRPSNGQTFLFTFPSGDLTPPTVGAVSITPLGGTCQPSSHTISVTPTDASGIASATLVYTVGNGAPVSLPMTRTGNTYSATIPAQGSNGVRYFVRVTDSGSNALTSTSATGTYRDAGLTINAGPNQSTFSGLTATLSASASLGGSVRITEFALYAQGGTGATNPYPSYIPAGSEDLVELTNLGTGQVDLSGYGFEVQGGAAARNYTFPAGTVLLPQNVLVLHLGDGTDDPGNNYYNTNTDASQNDRLFSGDPHAFVLSSATGQVVDAVVFNGFTPLAPITTTDFSGPTISSPTTIAGAGLYGPDNNDNSNWASTDNTPGSIGALNPGLPVIPSTAAITWTGPGITGSSTANPLTTYAFPAPGTYSYVASITNGACTATDTVQVIVTVPTAPTAGFMVSNTAPNRGEVVRFIDQSLNSPSGWHWVVTPSAGVSFLGGTSANSQNPFVTFADGGCYDIKLVVTNIAGRDSVLRSQYVCVALSPYCLNLHASPCTDSYINDVVLQSTTLHNRGTGCTAGSGTNLAYSFYNPIDSLTADVYRDSTYSLTVTSAAAGGIVGWIDYNSDEVFDTTEFILIKTRTPGSANQPFTVQIHIPGSAALGPTGMRIRSRRNATPNNHDACTLFLADGETEDYTLNIKEATPSGLTASRVRALDVYPNPTTGTFRVDLANTGARRIELTLTDALGRTIHTQRAQDNTVAEVRLPELAAGVYFLRVRLDNEVGFRRIEVSK